MNPQGSASLSRAEQVAERRVGAAVHKAGAASEETRLRRLRVLVMAQFVFKGRVGGAEHMLYNLLGGMAGACAELGVLCASERNLDQQVVRQLRRMPGVSVTECGGTWGPRFVAEQLACLRGDLSADATIFPNYFIPPLVPRRLGRAVVVLHDMQYRHFPQHFSRKKRAWLAASQVLAMRRADRVIALSRFVRDDIVRCYGRALERKITVIPNPISWDRFTGQPARPPPIAEPYVLSVAAHYPHKNLDVLVRAFAQIARRNPDLRLVFCGQDYGSLRGVADRHLSLAPLIEELGLSDRVLITGYVDDATLGWWYRHAALFAFPSVFEGFGMPPVEALGFGVPTLTTRLTALPEVTLGLAETVDDPFSADEWAARIESVVRSPARHRPSPSDVARLRSHYDPVRIGRRYLEIC